MSFYNISKPFGIVCRILPFSIVKQILPSDDNVQYNCLITENGKMVKSRQINRFSFLAGVLYKRLFKKSNIYFSRVASV